MKKKINIIILSLISLFIFTGYTKAASVAVTGNDSVTVGNSIRVNVTFSNDTPIFSIEASVSYDRSMLSLQSGDDVNINYDDSSNSIYSKTYSYVFKALKSGTTNVSVTGRLSDYNTGVWGSLGTKSKSIYIVAQQAIKPQNYSKDNNLSNLEVEGFTLTPTFNKDTLEYSLEVENNVEQVNVIATKGESHQSIKGNGINTLVEGTNAIKIDVEAQNGNVKTYTININRKELNPIIVKVDGKKYTVVRKAENLQAPNELFKESKVTISKEEIPCFFNEKLNYTLVGLKDSKGNINLYIYENNKYIPYKQINTGSVILIPIEAKETPKGYKKSTVTINKVKYDAFKIKNTSKFSLIYGKNIETGDDSFYTYDEKENTLQRYYQDEVNILNDKIDLGVKIGFGLICLYIILLVVLIITLVKRPKKIKVQPKLEPKEETYENLKEMATLEKTVVLDEPVAEPTEPVEETTDNKKKHKKKK